MQIYANVGTMPVRKVSKTTGKGYYELRLCESQRTAGVQRGSDAGAAADSQWYSCRIMKDIDPGLAKGDFVKVTGKLKVDHYLSREGKPTGTLLIIAFEASKIAKPPSTAVEQKVKEDMGVATPAKSAAGEVAWQD